MCALLLYKLYPWRMDDVYSGHLNAVYKLDTETGQKILQFYTRLYMLILVESKICLD